MRDRAPGLRALALQAASFAVAVPFWADLHRRGIRHVHVHFAGSPTHIAAIVAALGNAVEGEGSWKWSLSVHGPVEFSDLSATRLARRVSGADLVVAISDFARSQLLSLLPVEAWDKVEVVRCGVRPEAFAATGDPQANVLRVLSVGRLVAVKGQAVLLEAIAGLLRRDIECRLTLIGDGPERATLERTAARLGIADHVLFRGARGQDEVRRAYGEADVFCLSSFAEGVPVVLMEAMAAELPVVSTRIAGISELVEDEVSGFLVRPGRPDDVEGALERLASDPELRSRMGRRGRDAVVQSYDVRDNAVKLAGLFRARTHG